MHELRKEGDAERLVRAAFDAATLSPAEKTIHTFVAVGGDHTANAGMLQSHMCYMFVLRSHHKVALLEQCHSSRVQDFAVVLHGTVLIISLLMGAVPRCLCRAKSCTPPGSIRAWACTGLSAYYA